MFFNWSNYIKPLHLNNVNGKPVINGNPSNPTTTPFVILAESNGNSYVPNSTLFMDVYGGGAPYTFTQELVQRGAEIQEDTLRIAVSSSTFELAAQLVDTLRHALTEQESNGPQILQIKRENQNSYTEWFIVGAKIQEDQSYFSRDALDTAYPTIYLAIKLARSPYGSESKSYITVDVSTAQIYSGELISTGIAIADYPELFNSFVNIDFQYDFNAAQTGITTFGPLVFSIVDDDTYYSNDTAVSGTITAGATNLISTHIYNLKNVSNLTAPLCIAVVGGTQNNEIEMRATISGYATPFVRSVGTHINANNGNQRLFILPSFDVQKIFSGLPDYDMTTNISINIEGRNINRGASRTFNTSRVNIWRSNSVTHLFPTSNWSARTEDYLYYRVVSFYDQLELPAQPTPNVKSVILTANKNRSNITTMQNIALTFQEGTEIRGIQTRITQKSGVININAYWLDSNCGILYVIRPSALLDVLNRVRFSIAPVYQNIKGNL